MPTASAERHVLVLSGARGGIWVLAFHFETRWGKPTVRASGMTSTVPLHDGVGEAASARFDKCVMVVRVHWAGVEMLKHRPEKFEEGMDAQGLKRI